MRSGNEIRQDVRIPIDDSIMLNGELIIPAGAAGVVVFAHGSGSSRFSPRNRAVAETIREVNIGTLLFDLLTRGEESVDVHTGRFRFDIGLLANRLIAVTRWLAANPDTADLRIGYFGASTGGGAALVAAATLGNEIAAVVSRGGRPDMAGDELPGVKAATLLLVGELDETVIELNRKAIARMKCEAELKIIPGATHLFEEPGTLDLVASLAADWFTLHFRPESRAAAR